MAQLNESTGLAAAGARNASSTERVSDDVAIFSGPGAEAVFQWWVESKRRWTQGNRLETPGVQDDLLAPSKISTRSA
jgi:hypothetical protein